MSRGPARRWLVPEVVQASAMDCGPAALSALLGGFGIGASYGRLREACQTDVDGTSIDTLEELAGRIGLDAEQVIVPVEHVVLTTARTQPAIVVVQQGEGGTHFVVLWRRHGGRVQVMDPATGRRWPTVARFLDELYVHRMAVPAEVWSAYATSPDFRRPLERRLAALGIGPADRARLLETALGGDDWRAPAALDAACRMTAAALAGGGVRRAEATRLLGALWEKARADESALPAAFWSARQAPPDADGRPQVLVRGAVVVRVLGRREAEATDALPPGVRAALAEPPARPLAMLFGMLRTDGLLAPATLMAALLIAAAGRVFEAVLLRGVLDLGATLGLGHQRLAALGLVLLLLLGLLLLELPLARGLLATGRTLEGRLRMAFLRRVPLLGDRYLRSRLTSDMAERAHALQTMRELPALGGRFIGGIAELVCVTAGIALLDPAAAPLAVGAALLSVVVPLAFHPALLERDMRVRGHAGALSRYYLDALLGLVAVRAHGAEEAVRRQHEGLLVEWARAGRASLRAQVTADTLGALLGAGLAALLLGSHLARRAEAGSLLLLAWWALSLPAIGAALAATVRQYPGYRNTLLRLAEPLTAPTEETEAAPPAIAEAAPALRFEGVSVHVGGHTILHDIDLDLAPGEHVAIVGASGAGKSSLAALLLGWHRPAGGRVLLDGAPLTAEALAGLRRRTAWVDPSVHLWNRRLIDNVRYGAEQVPLEALGDVVRASDLAGALDRLPDGLASRLGEGGALLSGGEGQRVRLARAFLRPDVGLVILDEPFRGLDRERRHALLERSRARWAGCTLLCITHDVDEVLTFPRVLVVEGGRVVEDGAPAALAARTDTRLRAMVDADEAVRRELWGAGSPAPGWRRLRLRDGRLEQEAR